MSDDKDIYDKIGDFLVGVCIVAFWGGVISGYQEFPLSLPFLIAAGFLAGWTVPAYHDNRTSTQKDYIFFVSLMVGSYVLGWFIKTF